MADRRRSRGPKRPRRRAADGIRAKSQRGEIGDTWWSRRFVEVLESFNLGPRLARGRSYARTGQVLDLEVRSGLVTARVQGSRRKPYEVRIALEPLAEDDWGRVETALSSEALFVARLLAGEMPHDIEAAFGDCALSLFPVAPEDLDSSCSCPDWANPCKHIAATLYILAERFDADPFDIFAWRGRTRTELLERLRARRVGREPGTTEKDAADPSGGQLEPLPLEAGSFWGCERDLPRLVVSVSPSAALGAVLIQGGTTVEEGGRPDLVALFWPSYQAMAREARIRLEE